MALNKIMIMGNLVADPELKTTTSGVSVCSFRIGCARDYVAEGGQKTDFVDCVAWRKSGEFVSKYFRKGKPILIEGRLQMRQYETKDGQKRTAAEILVENSYFCGGDKVANGEAVPKKAEEPKFTELDMDDTDLPWEDHDLK